MKTILAASNLLKIEKIALYPGEVRLVAKARQMKSSCPSCGRQSDKAHSRYQPISNERVTTMHCGLHSPLPTSGAPGAVTRRGETKCRGLGAERVEAPALWRLARRSSAGKLRITPAFPNLAKGSGVKEETKS
jgi:hypothetical protein